MPVAFHEMRELEDCRVKMRFDDGREVIAHLLSAVEDIDGSQHLIYDRVEWANDLRELAIGKNSTVYAEGDSLILMEEAGPRDA